MTTQRLTAAAALHLGIPMTESIDQKVARLELLADTRTYYSRRCDLDPSPANSALLDKSRADFNAALRTELSAAQAEPTVRICQISDAVCDLQCGMRCKRGKDGVYLAPPPIDTTLPPPPNIGGEVTDAIPDCTTTEAMLLIEAELKTRNYPANTSNAGRAGWEACRHYVNRLAATHTKPQDAKDAERLDYLQPADLGDLMRFQETTDDDSYDIGKPAVKRLASLGVLESHGFGKYSLTAFGHFALEHMFGQEPKLPLLTNSDRDDMQRAAIANTKEQSK